MSTFTSNKGPSIFLTLWLVGAVYSSLPAYSGQLQLHEFTPWLVNNVGPKNAKGVIYWINGYTSDPPILDRFHLVPYFLKTLSESGWDVVGAKVAAARSTSRPFDLGAKYVPYVRRRVKELKEAKYNRVVLGGHSWGGWVSILAEQHDRVSDGLILSAPAIYGAPTWRGKPNPYFQRNLTEFGPLIDRIRTPTVLLVFSKDAYEPGERGALAERLLTKNKIDYLIFNKPERFTNHFAGWLPVFDHVYGHCIRSFLENGKTIGCKPLELSDREFSSIINFKQLEGAAEKAMTTIAGLTGRRFVAYRMNQPHSIVFNITPNQRTDLFAFNERRQDHSICNNAYCAGKTKSMMLRWSETQFLAFDPETGTLQAWWTEEKGPTR